MIKPKLQLRALADSDLSVSAGSIKAKLIENAATFPDSADDVTALGTELTAYNAAFQAVETERLTLSELVGARDNARKALEDRLRELATQVHKVAKGDIEIIHAAGMLASNEPQPVTMTQVQSLKVRPSEHEGEVLASWQPIRGARYYRVQVATGATPTSWEDHSRSNKAKAALNNTLQSGSKVYIRVCAVGANDEGAWSEIAWKTVP